MHSFIPGSVSPKIFALATISGLLTWFYLNRRSVRGDHAVLCCLIALVMLYTRVSHFYETISARIVVTCLISCVYALSTLFCTALYRLSPFHPLSGYPGPRLWWISSLRLVYVSFGGRRHLILDELHNIYGPLVRIGPNTLSINLLSASSIYGAQNHMEKSESYNTPGHLRATSLFFKQKTRKIHNDRKKIWSSAFTGVALANLFPALEQRTWELLSCIEERQSRTGLIELSDCLYHWAYDFMGDMVFGECSSLELMKNGDPKDLVKGGKQATIVLDSVGQSPWLMDIIWHLPAGKSMVRLRDVAADMMRTRIETDQDTTMKDLSSYLMLEHLSQEDLELEAVVAIQGGSDNTSTTMALAFYFLLSQPKYYEKLQSELDRTFPDATGPLDAGTLANIDFLNAVLNEALRLGSPFFLPRIVPLGGTAIEGNFIPEGTIVAIAAYSQQVSPLNFSPDPLEFRPERWLPEGLGPKAKTEKAALMSFSSGPHVCIAKAFAYQEMRLVMARIVLAFNMKLADDFDIQAYRDGILNMRTTILKKPLQVQATRRPGIKLS